MSKRDLTRREFLRGAALAGVGLAVSACVHSVSPTTAPTTAPVVSTPAPTVPPAPRSGGTLRVGTASDGTSIGFPPKHLPVVSQRQAAPALEPLLRTDKSGKIIPWLASDYKNDVAAKAVTLTLQKGVRFHDGTDFNADAVKWNLEQYVAAKSGGTEKFKSIDVVDDFTVRINLTDWDNTVTSNLAYTLSMIISPTAYKTKGADWILNNPVGTGAFEFVSWTKDGKTIYKKFGSYWRKGQPYLDGVQFIPITETTTRQLSFRQGELDIVLGLAPEDRAGLEKDGYLIAGTRIGSGATSLVPDSANPNSPWSKLQVRQAAQYAIDTDAIVKAIFVTEAEPANQWIYKGHWGYNPDVKGYPFDPAKAKQLLAEAGYPNGFKTKITYLGTDAASARPYTAVQGFLKAVGIDADLDPATSARWNEVALAGGKWEGLLMGVFWALRTWLRRWHRDISAAASTIASFQFRPTMFRACRTRSPHRTWRPRRNIRKM